MAMTYEAARKAYKAAVEDFFLALASGEPDYTLAWARLCEHKARVVRQFEFALRLFPKEARNGKATAARR